MSDFDPRLARRLGAAVAVALLASVAIGGVVLLAVVGLTMSDNTGDLSELGEAMAAGALAILSAGVAYTAATVIGVRRVVADGRRAGTVAALLLGPVVLVATARLAGPLGLAGALGVAAVTVIAVLALAGALDPAWAARLGIGTSCLAIVFIAGSVLSERTTEGSELRNIYRRAAIPLALVDGNTLDGPAPGWELRLVEHPLDRRQIPAFMAAAPAKASIAWNVPGSGVQLELLSHVPTPLGACPYAERGQICERLGATADGAAIWGGRFGDTTDAPGYQSIWVNVDGGRWQLSDIGSPRRGLDVAEATRVLSRLQSVDIDRYLAVAGDGRVRRR